MKNLTIRKEHDGIYLACDRGLVAKMMAGYADTQHEDAKLILAAVQEFQLQRSIRRDRS